MKKIAFVICLCVLFGLSSCEMFSIDNKDLPQETIQGRVIDVLTGDPVLTDQGSEGIRVSLKELSWGENANYNPDFYCMPNGTFRNTKIFKGNYNIRIDGPFIPLVRETSDGTVLFDGSKTMDIKGVTDVTFEVQPFLKVRFAGEPHVSGGVVTAQVIVERAVSEEEFSAKIGEMGNYDPGFFNVTDIQLFVSTSPSVGYRARDERWSSKIEYSGSSFNSLLGTPVTINSLGSIPEGYVVFVRAAARINYTTHNHKRWNYSEKLDLIIPVEP